MSTISINYINQYFSSTLIELEDIFLGYEVTPNVFIERTLYVDYGSSIEEFHKVQHKDYSNFDFDYSKINFNEIDFDYWNNYLELYKQSEFQDKINSFFSNLDNYIDSNNNKKNKFILYHLESKLLHSINSLKKELSPNKITNKKNGLNKHQIALINIFIEMYEYYLDRLKIKKYSSCLVDKNRLDFDKLIISNKISIEEKEIIKDLHQNYEELNYFLFQSEFNESQIIYINATLSGLKLQSMNFPFYKVKSNPLFYCYCDELGIIDYLVKKFGEDKNQIGMFLYELSKTNKLMNASNEALARYFFHTYKKDYPTKNNSEEKTTFFANKKPNINYFNLFFSALEKL